MGAKSGLAQRQLSRPCLGATLAAATSMVGAAGCGGKAQSSSTDGADAGDAPPTATGDAPPTATGDAPPTPINLECHGDPDPGPPTGWSSQLNELTAETSIPQHSATDAVTNPGTATAIHAKFSYGTVSIDLNGEEVVAYLCVGELWQEVGTATTDNDGRVEIHVAASLFDRPGYYPFHVYVRGDLSSATGSIFVVERGTQAVVFDIDGTLTTDDLEAVEQVVLAQDPELRAGAVEVVDCWAPRRLPVYITGRYYGLDLVTREWLTEQGFPCGPLFTTQSIEQWAAGVEDYKLHRITDLQDRVGLKVSGAYGNATTDICAYARAGIEPRRTYIIGPHGGEACPGYAATVAVDDYSSHFLSLPLGICSR